MREPGQFAQSLEDYPLLPEGSGERVSGYGVMGLPFASGHLLGLRRWTASSVGEGFTSIWHRGPSGIWTFYESAPSEIACTRYFGAGVECAKKVPIRLDWSGARRLQIRTADDAVCWTVELGSTPMTRVFSALGGVMPEAAWRSRRVLRATGRVAGWALGVGRVQLTGMTTNGQRFDANPMRIWHVERSQAVVEGVDVGRPGPLPAQAHLGDFYFPQRGLFAVGRVFVTPLEAAAL